MRKSNIFKIIAVIITTLLFFISLLLIKSADWFKQNYAEMDFSIVLYQLYSPLIGTADELLESYKNTVLWPTTRISLLVGGILGFLSIVLQRLDIKIYVNGKKGIITNNNFLKFRRCFSVVAIVAMLILLVNRTYAVGIPAFIKDVSQASTLYEDYYIDPSNVNITFHNKRNLLCIYMESMEMTYTSSEYGGFAKDDYIPELTDLALNNINFSNTDKLGGHRIYGTGWTIAGLLASTSGITFKIPLYNYNTAGLHEDFLPGVTSMGEILEKEGYRNYFLCGSEGEFAGRKQYFEQHGDYEILDLYYAREAGYIPEDYMVFWGYEDEILYEIAKEELSNIAESSEPFNFAMLTVDTHAPEGYVCDLCENEYEEQYANVLRCASKQLGDFINWCEEQDWYEDTTIVIMGDHTTMSPVFQDIEGYEDYECVVYNCFMNVDDKVNDCRYTHNRDASTMDMFPTLLASIGADIDGERLGLGTNLFSGKSTLSEKLGTDYYEQELSKNSNYYFSKFIANY